MLLSSLTKQILNSGSAHCRLVQVFDKDLKRFIYFLQLQNETSEIISM